MTGMKCPKFFVDGTSSENFEILRCRSTNGSCILNTWDERPFNPFPNKPWFLHVCSKSLLKTLWEKENLPPFLSNLKSTSANSFNLEGCKICRLGNGQDIQI